MSDLRRWCVRLKRWNQIVRPVPEIVCHGDPNQEQHREHFHFVSKKQHQTRQQAFRDQKFPSWRNQRSARRTCAGSTSWPPENDSSRTCLNPVFTSEARTCSFLKDGAIESPVPLLSQIGIFKKL